MKQQITKADHNKIIELTKLYTLQEVANQYDVSRERIRQILAKYGLKTPKKRFTTACETPGCPKTVSFSFTRDKYYCQSCLCYNWAHRTNLYKKKSLRYFEPRPNCAQEGCPRLSFAKGFCKYHRSYQLLKEDPEKLRKKYQYNAKRFKERYHTDPDFKERLIARQKAYREKNKEKINAAVRRSYYKSKERSSLI